MYYMLYSISSIEVPLFLGSRIFAHPQIQSLLERILFIWSVRHPASGYVQGINDLATPFVVVLLASEMDCQAEDIDASSA